MSQVESYDHSILVLDSSSQSCNRIVLILIFQLLRLVLVLALCAHQLVSAYHYRSSDFEPTRRRSARRPTRNNYIGEKFVNIFNRNRMRYDESAPAISSRHRSRYASGARRAVSAAVNTQHRIDFVNVDLPPREPIEPQVIDIESGVVPIILQFKSSSSPIQLLQMHQPGGVPEVQETKSEDQPHVIRHEVTKPIIQELREIIIPYRRIVQEVKPVQEEIQTIVARAVDQANNKSAQYNHISSGELNKSYYASSSELTPATSASEPVKLYATFYQS